MPDHTSTAMTPDVHAAPFDDLSAVAVRLDAAADTPARAGVPAPAPATPSFPSPRTRPRADLHAHGWSWEDANP
jgi:hypothetical protein